MSNYFILKIDKLINTFSALNCGKKITFSMKSKNEKEIFNGVEKSDYILIYKETIQSIYKVIEKKNSNEIIVEKVLETCSGIEIETSLVDTLLQEEIIKIEEEKYNEFIEQLINLNFPQLNNLVSESQEFSNSNNVPQKLYNLKNSKYNEIDRNKIFFGAPGTGKSHQLNKDKNDLLDIKDGGDSSSEQYERVTFHPDYSYANFVGTYKPIPDNNQDGIKRITYEFVPGPFIRTYVKAIKSARTEEVKPYLLIIEEINRANVAAVFGDIFQLLDRKDNGESEYSIHASEDLKNYLAKSDVLGGDPKDYFELRIPDNMFIWATMNSADQGVYPMDTAFKRRWNFEYLGIDNNQDVIEDKNFTLANDVIYWNLLRKSINAKLSVLKINEDKLLGPFFISKSILEAGDTAFKNAFTNKVLMYLFEDAAKHKKNEIFNVSYQSVGNVFLYSNLCNMFKEVGINIFNTEIIETYRSLKKEYNQEVTTLDTTQKVLNENEAE